eukprot:271990-Chlamydomonas_euryale.AAC.2
MFLSVGQDPPSPPKCEASGRSRPHLGQRVERNVSDVVVAVGQEASEHVDGEHAQPRDALDAHDGLDGLVEDGVAGVLGAVHVGGDLGHAYFKQAGLGGLKKERG